MQLDLERSSAKYQIKKYRPGCVTVNEQDYTTSILLLPDSLSAWPVANIQVLTQADLLALLEFKPEVILLGTGNKLVFPDVSITHVVQSNKVGLEVMATDAACRTYTILVAEQRRVLAALIID